MAASTSIIDSITHYTVIEDCDNTDIINVDIDQIIVIDNDSISIVIDERATVVVDDNTEFDIIEIGTQGPKGAQGLPGSGGIPVFNVPVAANQTGVIDKVDILLYRAVKWIMTASDNTTGLYQHSEVMSVHNGSITFFSRYALIGEPLAIVTLVDIVSGELRLVITNNHTEDLMISVLRFATET